MAVRTELALLGCALRLLLATSLMALAACGDGGGRAPAAATPSVSCPDQSVWNGQFCVPKVAAKCPEDATSAAGVCETTGARTMQAAPRDAWVPPVPGPRDTTAARVHFAEATKAYERGDYTNALSEFEAAYASAPLDAVLYNIAVTLERLGRTSEALSVYERYAGTLSPSVRSSEVHHRIDALKQSLHVP